VDVDAVAAAVDLARAQFWMRKTVRGGTPPFFAALPIASRARMASERTIAGLLVRARVVAVCMFAFLRGSRISSPNRETEH
jgi:hypothetical protein